MTAGDQGSVGPQVPTRRASFGIFTLPPDYLRHDENYTTYTLDCLGQAIPPRKPHLYYICAVLDILLAPFLPLIGKLIIGLKTSEEDFKECGRPIKMVWSITVLSIWAACLVTWWISYLTFGLIPTAWFNVIMIVVSWIEAVQLIGWGNALKKKAKSDELRDISVVPVGAMVGMEKVRPPRQEDISKGGRSKGNPKPKPKKAGNPKAKGKGGAKKGSGYESPDEGGGSDLVLKMNGLV